MNGTTYSASLVGSTFTPGYPANIVSALAICERDVTPWVVLAREPDNPVDPNAIAVLLYDDDRVLKVGHLPAVVAARVAPLLDARAKYSAHIESVINPRHQANPGFRVKFTIDKRSIAA